MMQYRRLVGFVGIMILLGLAQARGVAAEDPLEVLLRGATQWIAYYREGKNFPVSGGGCYPTGKDLVEGTVEDLRAAIAAQTPYRVLGLKAYFCPEKGSQEERDARREHRTETLFKGNDFARVSLAGKQRFFHGLRADLFEYDPTLQAVYRLCWRRVIAVADFDLGLGFRYEETKCLKNYRSMGGKFIMSRDEKSKQREKASRLDPEETKHRIELLLFTEEERKAWERHPKGVFYALLEAPAVPEKDWRLAEDLRKLDTQCGDYMVQRWTGIHNIIVSPSLGSLTRCVETIRQRRDEAIELLVEYRKGRR